MLPLLTKYLLRYKRVSIPHIGSFELVQEPPQIEAGSRLCHPPAFRATYAQRDGVTDHQSRFFSARSASSGLSQFGEQLHNRLRTGPVQWKGLGILSYSADEIRFEPQTLSLPTLQAVPLPTVIHGEKEQSTEITPLNTERAVVEEKKRSWEMTAGWTILLLALAAAFALLYQGGFSPAAAGQRLHW